MFDYGTFDQAVFDAPTNIFYSVAAAVGTIILTGVASIKKVARASATGAFVLTGVAVSFVAHISIICAYGVFVLTGNSIGIIHGIRLGYDRIRQTAAVLYKTRFDPPELEE